MAASKENFGCHTGLELLLASVGGGLGWEHPTVQRMVPKSAVLRLRKSETRQIIHPPNWGILRVECVCVPDNVLGQWPSSGLASMSSPWQDSSVRESELGLQDFRRRAGYRGETPPWAGGVSKQEGWTGAQVKPGTWDPTELTQCHQMDKQKAGDYSAENGSFQEWDCQICGSWPCINAA